MRAAVHPVGKRLNVELLEEGRLGGSGLGALCGEVDVGGHLNQPPNGLGSDLKGLEESGVIGVAAGGALDVDGGYGPNLGEGWADAGPEEGADLAKVAVGKDEGNVATTIHLYLGAGWSRDAPRRSRRCNGASWCSCP